MIADDELRRELLVESHENLDLLERELVEVAVLPASDVGSMPC